MFDAFDDLGEWFNFPHLFAGHGLIYDINLEKDTDHEVVISKYKGVIKQLNETNREVINKHSRQVFPLHSIL